MRLLDDKQIKEIEKIFSIEHKGQSRIDGYPIFNVKKDDVENVKEFFDIEIIPVLEDNIPNYWQSTPTLHNLPAGQKDCLLLKFVKMKKNYIQFLRREKLKKINKDDNFSFIIKFL